MSNLIKVDCPKCFGCGHRVISAKVKVQDDYGRAKNKWQSLLASCDACRGRGYQELMPWEGNKGDPK